MRPPATLGAASQVTHTVIHSDTRLVVIRRSTGGVRSEFVAKAATVAGAGRQRWSIRWG
jgi:hypothetical protein